MLFHTWVFFIFFILVFVGFWLLRTTRFWLHWLLLASSAFYAWWNPYYLFLIFYSTALDYYIVKWMEACPGKPGATGASSAKCSRWLLLGGGMVCLGLLLATARGPGNLKGLFGGSFIILLLLTAGHFLASRKSWLVISIVNNLSVLVFFKYADFFTENANALLGLAGLPVFPVPGEMMPFGWEYVLPVGISFYTFQSMSYTIDYYRGIIPRELSFVRFSTFVTFFPQLVAGPIERSKNLLPQFSSCPRISLGDITDGLSLFLVGLFKKVALANYLALYVERVYGDVSAQNSASMIMGTFAFAWQIYFDFSGYTDMARGVARCMGFRLMLNFNNPYLAQGLGEFWSRWHISLSTWFRDYVYIPLGGNRGGRFSLYRNLMITFLVSGLWHGAAWTFLVWGGLHGLGLLATRQIERLEWYREKVPVLVKQATVFLFVCFTWVFFRAESWEDAILAVQIIFAFSWSDPAMPIVLLLLVTLVWGYQGLYESRFRDLLSNGMIKTGMAAGMILWLFFFASSGGEFIYFQF